jgi:lysophospholipase L1-like esterase
MVRSPLRTAALTTVLLAIAGCSSSRSMRSGTGGSGGEPEPVGSGGATGDTGGKGAGGGPGGGTGGGTGGAAPADAGAMVADGGSDDPADAGQPADGRSDSGPADTSADRTPDASPGPDGAPPAAYDPCPPKGKPCVALPLGDSLTQGAGSSGGGYRRELFREIVARGQSIKFVGSATSGPAMLEGVPVPFPRNHEGHGGFTIQDISTWITEHQTIATYKPDLVMLEIGTNNGLRHPGADVPAALDALGALIDQILATDSRLLLIVAQITPTSTADGLMNVKAYNAGIPALVANRARAGKHIVTADIYQAFVANPAWKTAYLPASDVHPNDAGYDAMGRGWYGALGRLLR